MATARDEQVACRARIRCSRRRSRHGQLILPTAEDNGVHKPAHPCFADNDDVDDMVIDTPSLTIDDAVASASRLYGVSAAGSVLPSERDQNFLLQTESDDRFILKVANAAESRGVLEAQNAALAYVAR